MLRRYPRFKTGPVNVIARKANSETQHNDGPFYSSVPQESELFSHYECSEGEEDREDRTRSDLDNEQLISSSANLSSDARLSSRYLNVKLPYRSYSLTNSSLVRAPSSDDDDVPQIRIIIADELENSTSILDDQNSGIGSVLDSSASSPNVEDFDSRTYKRRYWILFVYCMLTWFSCVQWTGFGPICDSIFVAFPDWNPFTIAMMENWVSFIFVFMVLPVCWLTGRIGLRSGILISSFLLAVGLALRCITDKSPTFTIMCHVCSIFIGISMTLILSAPPMVASVWFPQHERTTAIALIFAIGQLGTVGSYLEPLVIRDPSESVPASLVKSDIMMLMYGVAGAGAALFLMILVYFPSSPPLPPSFSSSTNRLNFKEGLAFIIRNKTFVTFVTLYGLAVGPSLGWIGVLDFSLKPLGFTQNEAMYVGLMAALSCCVVTLITGKLTDLIYGHLKETIIGLLLASSVSYYWFLLLWQQVIPFSRWQIFMSVSLGLSLNYATIPLFYELSVEIVYPTHEVLVGGVVTAFDSLCTSAFLFMYSYESIGFGWVNYALVASNAIPVIGLLFVHPKYGRAKLDVQRSDSES